MTKRVTWQREAVRGALSSSDGFVSAQSLYSALRESGSPIGLATVYRALSDLAGEGEADSLQQEGESLYRNCGLTVEIEADEVEAWAASVAADHGFTQPSHVVDVFGLCANCQSLS